MKKCYIVSGFNPIIKESYDAFLIGVDKGCLLLAQRNIQVDVGIGDFDSITNDEFKIVQNNCKQVIKLNPVKDDTDLEHALKFAKDNGYDEIEIYGALGGRQDHNLLNLKLLYLYKMNICLYDKKNKIYCLSEGEYAIKKDDYKYISLFSFEKCKISIKGTVYELDNVELSIEDNYTTSNEIAKDECMLTIHKGRLLIIQTND